jgi:Mg-chelatase subunit ChlD
VQREVERVLDPKERRKTDDTGRPGGRPWLNVQPKVEFDRITTVQRLVHDPTEHAAYARKVDRHAQALRRYLEELGLGMDPERMRTAGTRLDPARLRALVLRGDPRVLVSRKRVEKADVFLGIVVDCSGSMGAGDLMERAKRFAVLLSEAARPLRGIDVRIFGFTDKVIYDAGDARSCAAHALRAGGGNNDAAALFHAAGVANQSRRRARVLVMISDGLPTECSVDALKNLVKQLGARERIVCAQVAVRPLSEVCFPHYVLVQDDDVQVAVRRFGEIVVRLVAGAMGP